ncbi:hypothetical protein [Acerihabitans arboris]|uniref:Uncharacterized protein n=1 Tax=Acerihabitans arboris TaxID=2691583 RepID=A0A845SN47_9GAMM|nr:hypothetical protein [Acerihabitans arboris]NDL64031.1 hypothetical protein [Acerihabitans arboris]
MDKITYSGDLLYGVINKKYVKQYNKSCAGRSLLIPRKIANSQHTPADKRNIFEQCGSEKSKLHTETGNDSHPAGSNNMYGNTFSGGLIEINNIHPSTTLSMSCSFNPSNISGAASALNISFTSATSGAQPYCRTANIDGINAAILINELDIHRLNMEKMDRIWLLKQESKTVKEQLKQDILRNGRLRKLIQPNYGTLASRQKQLHAPTLQAATPCTPHQSHIAALCADYHKLLTEIEASNTPPNTFIKDQDGQYLNSDVVILTLSSILHYLFTTDSDTLPGGARPIPPGFTAGTRHARRAAESAAIGASRAAATHGYELLRITPEYLEKTWQIKQHIIALINELNNELKQNAQLRRLMRQFSVAIPPLRHMHTYTLKSADLNDPQKCGICVLWTKYNNFFHRLKALKTQPYTFAGEYDVRYRNMYSTVFKLTYTLLSTLKKDKDILLDSLPRHDINPYDSIYPGTSNLSWTDITAAITIDPPVALPGDDFPRINLAETGKTWNLLKHINRIKDEFADALSLNFRLRQQLAQHLGPRAADMHFHTDELGKMDFDNSRQCDFCRLCANYNVFFNHSTKLEARFNTCISENYFMVFGLTHILLAHLKKDTQPLQDHLPSFSVE